jgi:N-ethylmaleimide reductase
MRRFALHREKPLEKKNRNTFVCLWCLLGDMPHYPRMDDTYDYLSELNKIDIAYIHPGLVATEFRVLMEIKKTIRKKTLEQAHSLRQV